ncbi:MAG: type II toxin-antitoxin system PemK/MazF family toxin [Planctomycetes bacterium]|nr:type II toxin-antitoxin system PemK/MazF family toxin [Planctomycetota bacterium]
MPKQGDIVRVNILDPNGKNPKNRRAVILTTSEEIDPDGDIVVAAISTKFDPNRIPSEYVQIPWDRNGHQYTTLTEPSVVKCNWLRVVAAKSVIAAGRLPGKYLYSVLKVVANLKE